MTPEQRAQALQKAAEARKIASEVKGQLSEGTLSLPALFSRAESDPVVARLKILAVVQSLPGQTRNKAKGIMEELGIDEGRRVKGLGSKQRQALLERVSA